LLRFLRHCLRVYSYTFEAALCLAALAFSAVIVASPHEDVRLGWLPWTGETLGAVLAVFGLAGLVFVLLALLGRARILLLLFALAGLVVVTRGLFFTAWKFSGIVQVRYGIYFVLALFFGLLGAVPMGRAKNPKYRRSR
jgi:hypothetical protein